MTDAAERKMVRRARLRMGVFVGLVVGMLLAVVGTIAYVTLVHSQEQQIRHELDFNAAHGRTAGPIGCNWIFRMSAGVVDTGPVKPPPGFPLRDALDRVAAGGPAETTQVNSNMTSYVIRTEAHDGAVIQVVFDARYQMADRHHLLLAFAFASVFGLIAALITGFVVGHRATVPLADALARQRRFVADASHELRTPIAQVHTRAQLLARRARVAHAPEAGDLERLMVTTRRLGEIVDELLLSARMAAVPASGADAVDLADLAAAAILTESDRAFERGVRLHFEAEVDELPVPGIESALRRVIGELLANALAHTPPGGQITVGLRESASTAELTVTDTGDGFDPADVDRIFDRFHRGPGSSGDRRFGLGLALLREVVTGHGGTISARSSPGLGATFTVRLPATRPATRSRRRLLDRGILPALSRR